MLSIDRVLACLQADERQYFLYFGGLQWGNTHADHNFANKFHRILAKWIILEDKGGLWKHWVGNNRH